MIDDEKIKIAANKFCDYGSILESGYRVDGFKKGACWAIKESLKDLWHPIDEEPTLVGEYIVVDILVEGKRKPLAQLYMGGEKPTRSIESFTWITDWKHFIKENDEVKFKGWYYFKDLIQNNYQTIKELED